MKKIHIMLRSLKHAHRHVFWGGGMTIKPLLTTFLTILTLISCIPCASADDLNSDNTTLYDVLHSDTREPLIYTMTKDEPARSSNYGTMQASDVTINGSGYGINGNGRSGIVIDAGCTLNISNVGAFTKNSDGSVNIINNGFNNFTTANVGAAINNYNRGTLSIDSSVFNGNSTTGTFNSFGGAIFSDYDGTITNIKNSLFYNNSGRGQYSAYGGAIFNRGTIDSIVGCTFINNSSVGASGGAIENNTEDAYSGHATIKLISNCTFIGNSANWNGGAIHNRTSNCTIDTIENCVFINNTSNEKSGAFSNGGTIKNIIRATFINNYAKRYGGATQNDATIENITDAIYTGNSADLNGGAIYNQRNGSIGFVADTKDTVFRDNYVGSVTRDADGNITDHSRAVANDIYNLGTINLSANNGHKIIFHGTITGTGTTNITNGETVFNNTMTQGTLNISNGTTVKLGSDEEQGTYGSLNLSNLTNDSNGGILDAQNDHIDTSNINRITLNSTLDYKLDVDVNNASADKIVTRSASSGTILITGLNFISGSVQDFIDKDLTIQVLKTQNDNLQLALSDDIASSATPIVLATTEKTELQGLNNNLNWSDTVNAQTTKTTVEGLFGTATTDTTNDSIGVRVTSMVSNVDSKPVDTLHAINTYNTADARTFTATSADETYTATEDAGETTAGNLTVNGQMLKQVQHDSEGNEFEVTTRSTLDFNSHKGFVLNNVNTTLTLKDVEVKGADGLVSGIAAHNATTVLDNVNIHDNGSGISTMGNIEIKGNSTISDNILVSGANSAVKVDGTDTVNLNAKLTGAGNSALNLNNGTINVNENAQISAFNSTLNNATLNISKESSFSGLNMTVADGQSTINIQNNNVGNLAFETLNTNGGLNMNIDVDIANKTADTVSTTNKSIGRVTISDINFINGSISDIINQQLKIQVLKTQDDGLQLALSDNLKSQFDSIGEILISGNEEPTTTYDSVTAQTAWNKEYQSHTKTADKIYGRAGLTKTDTENDSIGVITRTEAGITTDTSLGDTLKLVSADTTNATKEFNAGTDGAIYTATDNIGDLKGTLTVNGVSGGNAETLNLNGKTGFVLGDNAKALNFSNVTAGGSDTIANVTNSNATIEVNNTTLNGAITSTQNYAMSVKGTSALNASVGRADVTTENANLTMAQNAFSNANVTTDSGSGINLNNGNAQETYNFEKLTSNSGTKWNIDVDLTNKTSDKISAGTGSSGTITLSNLNFTAGDTSVIPSDLVGRIYVIKILNTPTDDLQLSLSSAVQEQLGNESYLIGTKTNDVNDAVQASSTWDTDYRNYTQKIDTYGKLGLATSDTTNDSIGVTYDSTVINDKVDNGSQGDVFKVVNQANIGDRNITTDAVGKTHTVAEDLGATSTGNLTVQGVSAPSTTGKGQQRSTLDFDSHKGFELNNANTTVTLKDVEVKGSSALVSGTASDGVTVVLDNANIHDNGSGVTTMGNVEVKGNSTVSDDIQVTGANSAVKIDGTDTVNLNAKLTGAGNSALNLNNGTINVNGNAQVSAFNSTLNNTTLNIAKESSLSGLNMTVADGQSAVNIQNGSVGNLALENFNLNGTLKMNVDADLRNSKMDTITAANAAIGEKGSIEVQKIKLLSPTTQKSLNIMFTNNKDIANAVKYTGEGTTVYSPIYKYKTSYFTKDDNGYFKFGLDTVGGGNDWKNYNPSVLVAPVAAQLGGYLTMLNAYEEGFRNLDMKMLLNQDERNALKLQNRYASTETPQVFSPTYLPEKDSAGWFRPYATFERVGLRGGPKVSNILYGSFFGGDSDMYELSHGWDFQWSLYAGYTGSHQAFQGNDIYQNGGILGATGVWYKGNFFTALTANVGASVAEASTMFGSEDFPMLMAGVASKTGYNFEFFRGKFIFQPYYMMSYTFVNTFNYHNGAGVRLTSDPLHAINIAPGIKLIGNLKNGWQPYFSIQMVWNIIDRSEFEAANVSLPDMSIKPYVQYGLGLQRRWGERFTGYTQAMIRNGGRNGVALSAGFRWALGKDYSKNRKTSRTDATGSTLYGSDLTLHSDERKVKSNLVGVKTPVYATKVKDTDPMNAVPFLK